MLPPPGPEPIRETEEIFLVDRIEHGDDCTLDDLILKRGNAQRALTPVRLRDETSPHGLRPVRAAVDSRVQFLKMILKTRLVVPPRHAILARSGTALERQDRVSERIDIDGVQQRRERLPLPLPCGLPYAFQPMGHSTAALSPSCAWRVWVSLGSRSWLHPFRRRHTSLVRRLHRYYGEV